MIWKPEGFLVRDQTSPDLSYNSLVEGNEVLNNRFWISCSFSVPKKDMIVICVIISAMVLIPKNRMLPREVIIEVLEFGRRRRSNIRIVFIIRFRHRVSSH